MNEEKGEGVSFGTRDIGNQGKWIWIERVMELPA